MSIEEVLPVISSALVWLSFERAFNNTLVMTEGMIDQ
jgi:hypothetical protein